MAGFGLHRNLYQTDRLNGFYVDAGINAFVMTRKDVNDNRPFPGMLPSLTVGNEVVGVNLTDTETMDAMVQSGCVELRYGIESASAAGRSPASPEFPIA